MKRIVLTCAALLLSGQVLADDKLRSDAVHANAQGYAEFAHSLHQTVLAAGLLRQ